MYSIWTKHLETQEEKDRFIAHIESAQPVLEVLSSLLSEKMGELDRSFLSLKQYQNPNWMAETAHKNGMASAYNAVRELVTIKDHQ